MVVAGVMIVVGSRVVIGCVVTCGGAGMVGVRVVCMTSPFWWVVGRLFVFVVRVVLSFALFVISCGRMPEAVDKSRFVTCGM